MKIKKASAEIWKAKLNQPFKIASGAHTILENVLFSIELEDGTCGYGEAAVATHITGETVAKTFKNLEAVARWIRGHSVLDYAELYRDMSPKLSGNKCALAAVEMAVLDALTRGLKIPLWKCFGDKPQILKTDLTIVVGSAEETKLAAGKIYRLGIRTLKIKVGKNPELDLERVQLAAKAAPGSRICLDANQGFTAKTTLKFLDDLKRLRINPVLVEQPVPKSDWQGMIEVSRKTKVMVCADESASSVADIQKLSKLGFKGAVNIKFVKFGILGACEAVAAARTAGFKLMMGVMMESPLATTAAAHFAAGLGGFDFIDLDSPYFMKEKITRGFSIGRGGVYDLRQVKSGIGVVPLT